MQSYDCPLANTTLTIREMSYSGGETYSGQWLGGLRHGHGTMLSQDESYEGDWEYNIAEGKGKLTHANGDTYEGYFSNN